MNTVNALIVILIIIISFLLAEVIDKKQIKTNQLICLKTDKIISRHNIILECWSTEK